MNPERMQYVRGVRSAAQRHQSPGERHAVPALGEQLLLLLRHVLPLLHVLRHPDLRRPPLRREAALRQPPGEALRDPGRGVFAAAPKRPRAQLDRRGLGQHVDHGGFHARVGGEDRFDPGDAAAAHHAGDVEEDRRVAPLGLLLWCSRSRAAGLESVGEDEARSSGAEVQRERGAAPPPRGEEEVAVLVAEEEEAAPVAAIGGEAERAMRRELQ